MQSNVTGLAREVLQLKQGKSLIINSLTAFELMVLANILVPCETDDLAEEPLPHSTIPVNLKHLHNVF